VVERGGDDGGILPVVEGMRRRGERQRADRGTLDAAQAIARRLDRHRDRVLVPVCHRALAAREALETERQRYRDLFEFAPDGYLVTDADGTIQEANQAAALLLGVRQDFLGGKPLVVFVVPSHVLRGIIERARPFVRPGVVLVSDNESWVYAGRAFGYGRQGATGVMQEWQRFVTRGNLTRRPDGRGSRRRCKCSWSTCRLVCA